MADRYDPKLSVRPLSERKPAPPPVPSEDPLAELARIVSGRATFDPPPPPRQKTVPANGAVASDVALANDLESELLNDLQASFSSTFYAAPPPPSAPAAPPPAPKAAAAPAPKPAAVQAAPAPKPAASMPAPKPQPAAPPVAAAPAPPVPPPAPSPAPVIPLERGAAKAERPASPPPPPRTEKPVPTMLAPRPERQPAAAVERPQIVRPASPPPERAEKPEFAEAALRPTAPAHAAPAEAPSVKPGVRWERPAEPRPPEPRAMAQEPSRFAPPPRGAALFRPKAAAAPPVPEADDLPQVVPFGAASDDEPYEEGNLGPEDLDALALYGEDDSELPPIPDELEHPRPRRGLFIGGTLLAVALAAGIAFVMTRSERSAGTPPIIAADATPAKVAPAVTPADNDEQNKLIYDRVDGAQSADKTNLVTPGNDKVAATPATSGDDNNPISRVIEPAGPGFDQPAKGADAAGGEGDHPAADSGAAPGSDGDSGQISPKKVRTVVVRPDMTVVSSKAASADESGKLPPGATPAVPPVADNGAPADPSTDGSGKAQTDAVADSGKGPAGNADPLAVNGGGGKAGGDASAGAAPAASDGAAPGSVPAGDGAATPASGDGSAGSEDASAGPAAPAKSPTPPTKPSIVASRGAASDAAANKAGKAGAGAATSSGGVFVQVSAQKSEDAAKSTYHDLQIKFPAILGKLDPNIQRADLGDKGVYYRVRVGPFASADAQKICGSYKAAGGSCIIAH